MYHPRVIFIFVLVVLAIIIIIIISFTYWWYFFLSLILAHFCFLSLFINFFNECGVVVHYARSTRTLQFCSLLSIRWPFFFYFPYLGFGQIYNFDLIADRWLNNSEKIVMVQSMLNRCYAWQKKTAYINC